LAKRSACAVRVVGEEYRSESRYNRQVNQKSRSIFGWYRLQVKVRPGASRSTIVGYDGAELKVDIAAPAVERRANDKLIAFLADQLAVGVTSVVILRGQSSRVKLVGIAAEATAVDRWLTGLPGPRFLEAPPPTKAPKAGGGPTRQSG
jgi:uncharacterized protein (TIGR00251 family)